MTFYSILFLRELANGTMALLALLLLVLFIAYIWHNRGAWDAKIVRAATAITIILSGHFLRSTSSWVEFRLLENGYTPEAWVGSTWQIFVVASVLIISGKILAVHTFASDRWRWWIIGFGLPCCLIIPLLVLKFM